MSRPAPGLTVLGVAPAPAAARLMARLDDGARPTVTVLRTGAIAAFAAHGDAWRRHRAILRARLSRAVSAAAFLPADPRHAACDALDWPRVVSGSAAVLAGALAEVRDRAQWDITISPAREGASPAEAASLLRDRLAEAVLSLRLRGHRGGLTLSALVRRGGGRAVAGAVSALPKALAAGCRLVLDGPLPTLGFFAFRLERPRAEDVSRAWALFALKDIADPEELARRWRGLAFALDPARAGRAASPRPLREAERAYGLLHRLSAGLGQDRFARADLLSLCGAPLAMPDHLSWGYA